MIHFKYTFRDKDGTAWARGVDDMMIRVEPVIDEDGASITICDDKRYVAGQFINKLSEYEEAEETRKLLILPCAIGEKIYRIEKRKGKDVIAAHVVEKFEIGTFGMYLCFGWRGMGYEVVRFNDIGKIVFLTREEAEAALKGERNETTDL